MKIRGVKFSDFDDLVKIYDWYVRNTTSTLDLNIPNRNTFLELYRKSVHNNLPFLVAEVEGKVIGYAYAYPFVARCFTNPIPKIAAFVFYISKDYTSRGLGTAFLKKVNSLIDPVKWNRVVAYLNTTNVESTKFFEKQIREGEMREV